jgi:hypothetical protein
MPRPAQPYLLLPYLSHSKHRRRVSVLRESQLYFPSSVLGLLFVPNACLLLYRRSRFTRRGIVAILVVNQEKEYRATRLVEIMNNYNDSKFENVVGIFILGLVIFNDSLQWLKRRKKGVETQNDVNETTAC